MADYSEISDPHLQARIRARYQQYITSFQALGFRPLAYCLEALGPYSILLNLPILLLSFSKEVIIFSRPLRFAVGNVLLSHSDPPSIALCMGMGVKIYTGLPEGALLISSDFKALARPRPGSSIIRLSPFSSIEEAWRAHRERAIENLAQRPYPSQGSSFRDYVAMSHREEEMSQYY